MEYNKANRVDKRKVLSEHNDVDARYRQPQVQARYSGISNSRNAIHSSEKGHNKSASPRDLKANCNEENLIDLSRVKKEPRANIHKLEKKKEEESTLTYESQNDENTNSKRKKVENPENDSSYEADCDDIQDTRMPWDENSPFEFGELSPSLTDLIFKPRPNKICRPPNAFMLFAKEQRRQVGMDHPEETNRQISILLGNMWRDLSDDDKMKYYKEAQALEKLHKETYPSYVYSPSEARMRKQSKAERRQKLKETPPSSIAFFVPEDGTGLHQSNKENQEKSAENIANSEDKNPNENVSKDTRQPIQENLAFPTLNPFCAPLYFPYPYRAWPAVGNRMLGRSMCTPQCNCPYHGANKGSAKSQSTSAWKGNPRCPPPTYFNNLRTFSPFTNPMYPFPSRPMLQQGFHPAFWNPWMLWPGPFYCPPPMTSLEELQKNLQRFRVPQQQVEDKQRPGGPSTAKRAEAISQQNQAQDSDDDDDDGDFRPLVIDDGKNSDGDKENSK